MALYDPEIIQQYAESLYRKADQAILAPAISMGVGGLILGMLLRSLGAGSDLFTFLLLAGGAGTGWYAGQARAFQLRLQAQQALCQLQIEINTRPSRESGEEAEAPYRPNWGHAPQ